MWQKRKGATSLAEVAVVVALIAILASVGSYYTSTYVKEAKYARAREDIALLAAAVSVYKYENKKYPTDLGVLSNEKSPFSHVPYVLPQNMPTTDPWNEKPYDYAHNDDGFAIWTFGENLKNDSGGGGGILPAAYRVDDVGIFGQN